MNSRRSDAHCYVLGCAVDCHAMNFQPFGVFVQALRNTSLKLRGWPLISASIAARPVMSAVSPARRTLRSLQAALLYFVLPERREASHVGVGEPRGVGIEKLVVEHRRVPHGEASRRAGCRKSARPVRCAAKSPLHIAA